MNQPRLFYSKTDYFSKVLLYMLVYTCNNKIIFTSLSLPLPDCEWAVMASISSISLYPLSFSLSVSFSLSLSHLAGLWVGSEGFHQLSLSLYLSLSLTLTLPDCEWAVKASTSCEAQVTCSWVGENARWTMGTWEGWMTCLPVNPILAPSRDCCSIPSKSAKISHKIQNTEYRVISPVFFMYRNFNYWKYCSPFNLSKHISKVSLCRYCSSFCNLHADTQNKIEYKGRAQV